MYLACIVGLAMMYRKVYFNDQHENLENVANQKQFIRYFDYELFAHCWVQVPVREEEVDEDGNKLMTGSFAFKWQDPSGNLMCHYHIECHPGSLFEVCHIRQ